MRITRSGRRATVWSTHSQREVVNAREPRDVWVIRQAVQHWPLRRGRGIVLRLGRRRLARGDFPIVIGPGAALAPELHDWIVRHAFEGGHLRDPSFRYGFNLLRPGDLAIDVGANIGLWSLIASGCVGPAGAVWAFEPDPDTVDRLRRNWVLSGSPPQVKIHASAVSDHHGFVRMHCSPASDSSTSSLRPLPISRGTAVAPSVSLDEIWLQAGRPAVRLLKVDVEGAETLVFEGARDLLSTGPTVIFEVNPRFLNESGSSIETLVALLAECRYAVRSISGVPLRGLPSDHCDLVAEPVFPRSTRGH